MYNSNPQPDFDMFLTDEQELELEQQQEEQIEEMLEGKFSPYKIENWDELGDVMYDKTKELAALLAQGEKLDMAVLGQFMFDAIKDHCISSAKFKLNI